MGEGTARPARLSRAVRGAKQGRKAREHPQGSDSSEPSVVDGSFRSRRGRDQPLVFQLGKLLPNVGCARKETVPSAADSSPLAMVGRGFREAPLVADGLLEGRGGAAWAPCAPSGLFVLSSARIGALGGGGRMILPERSSMLSKACRPQGPRLRARERAPASRASRFGAPRAALFARVAPGESGKGSRSSGHVSVVHLILV